MPTGSYLHLDPFDGSPVAVEEFSCAAGPAGWRYAAVLRAPDGGGETGRVDVTLDGGGRQVRVELLGGGWRLRGGAAGGQTVWLRLPGSGGPAPGSGSGSGAGAGAGADAGDGTAAGGEAVERSAAALGLTGRSPAFLVAAARRLRLSAGGRARVRLVALSEPALGTRLVDEQWSLIAVVSHPTDLGPLPVARYDVLDLGTGETRSVHLAGDVVVAAPDLELTALHSPPTR